MVNSPPKAILYDWDNTLVNSWPIIHQALSDTFAKWNKPVWTLEETKLRVGKSLNDAFPSLFGDEWRDAGDYYIQQYRHYHIERLEVLPGALETLKYTQEAPYFTGIVSNKRSPTLAKEAKHLGWDSYVDVLVGAGDAARDKPHADPAQLALDGSGVSMDKDVWFIGDTTTDLGCAQAGGMTAVLFGDVTVKNGSYREFPVDIHVRNHAELLSLLRSFA